MTTSSMTASSQEREALYAAGHHFFARDRYADAASFFRLLLVAAPDDERGWLGLGLCHERLEEELLALEIYGTGAQLARQATRCLLASARIARGQGDRSRALEILDAAEEACATDDERELVAHEKVAVER